MLEFTVWIVFLAIALFVLIRGADFFVVGAKQVGSVLGMSKFAIGVLIVGFGTSLPELASSIAAAWTGATEIVVANVVGSNITNILLVVGVLALLGGPIVIKRDLIKTELPIFFISTALFLSVVFDGTIDRIEALFLLCVFGAYMWYLFSEAEHVDDVDLVRSGRRPRLEWKSILYIGLGLIAVLFGAKYTVDMVLNIATFLNVSVGLVSIIGIALGTSLPELFISLRSIGEGEAELAVGNIFGSNAFNILMVIGIPGLITPLVADTVVMELGLMILLASSAILFVTGLARRIMRWEGLMLLVFFGFFVLKLAQFV
ncbi:calcium/sodium antiporter [Candidatus Kaiserbacteria bacterium]|nr:calcium/sodium antiporter [Candidatus Kaiserbacteria bacterium]